MTDRVLEHSSNYRQGRSTRSAGSPFSVSEAIPSTALARFPGYLRVLRRLAKSGRVAITSSGIASELGMTPVLVRKDLSMLGHYGKSRRGYEVSELQSAIKSAMGLDRRWNIVIVGSGMHARTVADLISHAGESFKIVGVFTPSGSVDEAGATIAGQSVQPVSTLPVTARRVEIHIGVTAGTTDQNEMILSMFDACGVRAVIDCSGGYPASRPGIDMRHFDLLPHLSGLTHGLLHPELLETG